MAVKKTAKKRRAAKKVNVVSIENIIDALQSNAELSGVNKRTIIRLNKSEAMVARQEKSVAASLERVDKARVAIADAKTPAAKDKAKARLTLAQIKAKEIKANLSMAVAEQKKAERLARGLFKVMESARVKMMREYDKSAKAQEKAIDKPARRRRTSKKKVVMKHSPAQS